MQLVVKPFSSFAKPGSEDRSRGTRLTALDHLLAEGSPPEKIRTTTALLAIFEPFRFIDVEQSNQLALDSRQGDPLNRTWCADADSQLNFVSESRNSHWI